MPKEHETPVGSARPNPAPSAGPPAAGPAPTPIRERAVYSVRQSAAQSPKPRQKAGAAPAGPPKPLKPPPKQAKPPKPPKSLKPPKPPKQPRAKKESGGFFHFIGNALYALGFGAEYYAVMLWRLLRDVTLFTVQLLAVVFGGFGRFAVALLRGLVRDLLLPVRRFRKRRRQLRRIRARVRARAKRAGAYETAIMRRLRRLTAVQLLANVLAYLLPVAAAAALVLVVYNIGTNNYALRVELGGVPLGYVADQSVVESAKALLRDRISLAPNQQLGDWQLNPSYSIAMVRGDMTTAQQMVDRILRNSTENPSDIAEGTGLYINDRLYAVTTEGGALRSFLEQVLAEQTPENVDNARASFVRKVECDTAEDEKVYFTSSVQPLEDILERLSANVLEARVIVADGGQSLAEIAYDNDLTVDELRARNPVFAEEEDGYIPAAGRSLLVRRAVPLLQVQVVERRSSVEEVPFETLERENNERALGSRLVAQQGVPGSQEVWDDYIYIDGELARTERIDDLTVVRRQPVEEIVEVGTYDFGDVPTGEFGAYYFPVPAAKWGSRGFGGHRGLDINAPEGTPIFACNEGNVITAGWNYSYGWYVEIEHPDGMVTLYGHCSYLAVEQGDHVMRGEYIAGMGSTGYSTGNHLHLEFKPGGGAPVDPLGYVSLPEGYSVGRYVAPDA